MALNLDSVFFFASRAAIPFLKKGENASIINAIPLMQHGMQVDQGQFTEHFKAGVNIIP
jgi:NAD(P)-dependent dehydrogenase (short-subunit alcohol dehydrogenase family)